MQRDALECRGARSARGGGEAFACGPHSLFSTDYVFDGSKERPYVEDDAVNPQNVYGRSKLAGEQAIIAAAGCHHLIFRTSWVYGSRGKNFLLTMLRLGAEREELSVVADQFGAPTWSNTIASLSANILAQSIGSDQSDWWQQHSWGYRLTASGETSWHGFTEAIFELSDLEKGPRVKAIPAVSYPTSAARPSNSRMSNDKTTASFDLRAPAGAKHCGCARRRIERLNIRTFF